MNKFITFPFEIKGADEKGIIEGYASTFNNVDLGFDIVLPGAFKRTLKNSKGKIPVLADHNPFTQIGWGLEAREDDKGLWVKASLDIENNQKAKEKHSLAKKAKDIGAKSGLSIGYQTLQSEDDPNDVRVRILKEKKLFEYSLVAFPMNTEAQITAVKKWAFGFNDLSENLKLFIETMREKGHSEIEILSAFKNVMKDEKQSDTDEIIKLLDEGNKRLESLIKKK